MLKECTFLVDCVARRADRPLTVLGAAPTPLVQTLSEYATSSSPVGPTYGRLAYLKDWVNRALPWGSFVLL